MAFSLSYREVRKTEVREIGIPSAVFLVYISYILKCYYSLQCFNCFQLNILCYVYPLPSTLYVLQFFVWV